MNKKTSVTFSVVLVAVAIIIGFTVFYRAPGVNSNLHVNQTSTVAKNVSSTTIENIASTTTAQRTPSYEFHVNLPNSLMLVDPQGRRTGKDPATGIFYHEIPGTGYGEDNGSGELATLGLSAGQYKLYVLGGGNGSYWIEGSENATGTIQVGTMRIYILNLPSNGTSSMIFVGSVSSTVSVTAAVPNNLPLK